MHILFFLSDCSYLFLLQFGCIICLIFVMFIYIDHMPCLNEDCVKEVGGDAWFCGEKCQEVC